MEKEDLASGAVYTIGWRQWKEDFMKMKVISVICHQYLNLCTLPDKRKNVETRNSDLLVNCF